MLRRTRWASLFAVVFTALFTLPTWSADHRDGTVAQDQPADIADTYAFLNPNDTSKVILGVTVNPYTVPGVTGSFSTDLLYQLKIDNDGDFIEDLVIQATYDVLGGAQMATIRGPARPLSEGSVSVLLKGDVPTLTVPSNGTIVSGTLGSDPVRVYSGRTDDPFFIDLTYVRAVLGTASTLSELLARRMPGTDLFTGLNVSSLMIELPVDAVTGSGSTINVWSTVSRERVTVRSDSSSNVGLGDWIQIDREGLPAVNAALVPPSRRDDFNRASPDSDFDDFSADVAGFLDGKKIDQGGNLPNTLDTLGVADIVFPDVLALDTSLTAVDPTCGTSGAIPGLELCGSGPSLNGRAPRDDFIDLFLAVLSENAITSDGLAANDCTSNLAERNLDDELKQLTCSGELDNGFPTVFPFLGIEHAPQEPIKPRN